MNANTGFPCVEKTRKFSDYTLGELQALVLSSLSAFRDEGLIALDEYLRGERELLALGIEDAVAQSRDDVYSLASMVVKVSEVNPLNSDSHVSEMEEAISDILLKMKDAARRIGPFWVADGLFSLSQESDSSISDGVAKNIALMVECMKSGRQPNISKADVVDIINAGRKLDFGAYLDLLTRQNVEHPWGFILNMDHLTHIFSLLTDDDLDRSFRLIKNLQESARNCDMGLFTETLTEIVGRMVMTDDELAEEYKKWKNGQTGESWLDKELGKYVDALMDVYVKNDDGRKDIAALALTYLFDSEDYIDDEVAFMGTMDDLYVLRTACALVECG